MLKRQKNRQARYRPVRTLAIVCGLLIILASLVFSTRGNATTRVYAASASTLNFQARLQSSVGAIVPDGNYNIDFKIYRSLAAGASAQGTCTGSSDDCLWEESYTGANQVRVQDGYFSVYLGSQTAFPTTINWSANLYITMNIGGTGAPSYEAGK